MANSGGAATTGRKFASVAAAAETLPVRDAVLDGEAIVQDARGVADFSAAARACAKARRRSHLLRL
jgi:ATP-dependent DNA ligase